MCSGPSRAYRYGERKWLVKESCQRITRKFCNLTMETGNFMEPYYARVTAISAGGRSVTKMTDRFTSLQQSEWAPLTAGEGQGEAPKGRGQFEMWLLEKVVPTREHLCTVSRLSPAPSWPPKVRSPSSGLSTPDKGS